jgi:hypothetical protein
VIDAPESPSFRLDLKRTVFSAFHLSLRERLDDAGVRRLRAPRARAAPPAALMCPQYHTPALKSSTDRSNEPK